MLESELVEGAEYEGNGTASGRPRRGKLSLAKTAENPFSTPSAALFGVKDGDISPGEPCYVRLDSLRRISPVSEPARVADGDRLFETGCCLCGRSLGSDEEPRRRYSGPHEGAQYCGHENPTCVFAQTEGTSTQGQNAVDSEITRRKSIAANAPKLSGSDIKPGVAHYGKCSECGGRWHRHADRCLDCNVTAKELACRAAQPKESCEFCGAQENERHADGCHAITADNLALRLRNETLAAEEAKRKHYLDRCAAYAFSGAPDGADRSSLTGAGTLSQESLVRRALKLDATIARVKPNSTDSPAYVNHNWPPADETDP